MTNPKILFLDEPTSGLDSALSLEVCSYIKSIGRRNNVSNKSGFIFDLIFDSVQLVIIASIHQPSSATFQQFDKLCLLSGGKTCYFGPITEAAS